MADYDISVVIPVYNAEDTIGELVQAVVEAFDGHGELQVVLVNDFSRDRSHEICAGLAAERPGVVYVRLGRNFGEHNAVMAGLRFAEGRHVVVMDDDFQNAPADAVRLVEAARSEGHDVVYSAYPEKRHSPFRNLGSRFNDRIATWLLRKPKDLYLSSFKCMDQWVVRQVTRYDGPYPYLDGLILRSTQSIGVMTVAHHTRAAGSSGYTIRKLVRLWLAMFVNFSVSPLRAATVLGFFFVLFSFGLMVWIIVEKMAGKQHPPGWAFLAVMVTLFPGVQLMMLGLVGEYVGRLLLSVNRTPQFTIREVVSGEAELSAAAAPRSE